MSAERPNVSRRLPNRMEFTDRSIRAMSVSADPEIFWDASLPGFGLRVTPLGCKTWLITYRHGRRQRWKTIGRYPKLGLAAARRLARADFESVAAGQDPQAHKVEQRTAWTFGTFQQEYLEKHAKARKKSWQEDEQVIRRVLTPEWEHRLLKEIAATDVRAVLRPIVARKALIRANRVYALISKMFAFALKNDFGITDNPCRQVEKPLKNEHERERVLSPGEIVALWTALEGQAPGPATITRLRLVTAQRMEELLSLRASHVNEDETGWWWTMPAAVAKNRNGHKVPLSPLAMRLLQPFCDTARERGPEALLFPLVTEDAVKKTTRNAVAAANLKDVQGRDLRRTAATTIAEGAAGSEDVLRFVIARVLNHKQSGITKVYERSAYNRQKRAALDWWGNYLCDVILKSTGESRASEEAQPIRQSA